MRERCQNGCLTIQFWELQCQYPSHNIFSPLLVFTDREVSLRLAWADKSWVLDRRTSLESSPPLLVIRTRKLRALAPSELLLIPLCGNKSIENARCRSSNGEWVYCRGRYLPRVGNLLSKIRRRALISPHQPGRQKTEAFLVADDERWRSYRDDTRWR